MSLTCPIDLDTSMLRREISAMYARVATAPDGEFHFHRGPAYAARMLDYDAQELERLPAEVTARFAGVGNPHGVAPLQTGATVVDVGCGGGMDLLLAALHIGPTGRAIGIDMTAQMREQAAAGARTLGLGHVEVRDGDATQLPVDDGSVDVVISNGVLNLVPRKDRAIAEIARVLKPGGHLQIADIVIGEELPDNALRDIDLWTG
jgi:SAM-dependent methyltransferase